MGGLEERKDGEPIFTTSNYSSSLWLMYLQTVCPMHLYACGFSPSEPRQGREQLAYQPGIRGPSERVEQGRSLASLELGLRALQERINIDRQRRVAAIPGP